MAQIISQKSFFYNDEIESLGDLERLQLVINNIDDEKLIEELYKIRGNGRNDFPVRPMLNSIYAMYIFEHKTVSSLIRELSRNSQLRKMCGFVPFYRKNKKTDEIKLVLHPSNDSYTTLFANLALVEHEYERIFKDLVTYMGENIEGFGKDTAGDGKIISSYANKPPKEKKEDGRRDTDADFTIKEYQVTTPKGEVVTKKKTYFGYRVHAIVDTLTELPIEIEVGTASSPEKQFMYKMLENMQNEQPDIFKNMESFSADKGYDWTKLITFLEEKEIAPIIDIRNMWKDGETTKQYKDTDLVYTYNGEVYFIDEKANKIKLKYLGYDKTTKTLRYGFYPQDRKTNEVFRIEIDYDKRIFTTVARDSAKWKRMYNKRTSVERYNGRLDRDLGFEIHAIRGLKKMKARVYFANIIMLAMAKGKIEAGKKENLAALKNAA